jgi:hypothetical protein
MNDYMINVGNLKIDKRILFASISKCEYELFKLARLYDIGIMQVLLQNENFNPSMHSNELIRKAFNKGHHEILDMLWKDERIKNTLKNDRELLYNKLKTNSIKSTLEDF